MDIVAVWAQMVRAFFPSGSRLAPWAWPLIVLAALLVLIGYSFAHIIRKRRFNRRNSAGVEQFPSYGAVVLARAQELSLAFVGAIIVLLGFAAAGIAVVGFAFR